eukprot:Hpha_TRINITY_DN2446_c0_g1::TRINITY_DN2446_c0_g1_i1::g.24640::m.24640
MDRGRFARSASPLQEVELGSPAVGLDEEADVQAAEWLVLPAGLRSLREPSLPPEVLVEEEVDDDFCWELDLPSTYAPRHPLSIVSPYTTAPSSPRGVYLPRDQVAALCDRLSRPRVAKAPVSESGSEARRGSPGGGGGAFVARMEEDVRKRRVGTNTSRRAPLYSGGDKECTFSPKLGDFDRFLPRRDGPVGDRLMNTPTGKLKDPARHEERKSRTLTFSPRIGRQPSPGRSNPTSVFQRLSNPSRFLTFTSSSKHQPSRVEAGCQAGGLGELLVAYTGGGMRMSSGSPSSHPGRRSPSPQNARVTSAHMLRTSPHRHRVLTNTAELHICVKSRCLDPWLV